MNKNKETVKVNSMRNSLNHYKMMNKNDEMVLEIHDLLADGHGVGKAECGRAVFVPGALPGDVVRTKILKVKKQYAFGKILQIIEPSSNRLNKDDPRICPETKKSCGGCQFQQYEYAAQLSFKEKLVKDALERIGKVTEASGCESLPISPIIGMDEPYNYRNKGQFPVGPQGMGLYSPRSHKIVPIACCNIQLCEAVFVEVQKELQQHQIPTYNEETHKGLLRHVVIRVGENTGEIMVIFVLNAKWPVDSFPMSICDDIAATIGTDFGSSQLSVVINENTDRTNVVLGNKFTTLRGSGYIHEEIGHIRYRISPRAFFQVNTAQTAVLYEIIANHLHGGKVIDAYSGIGGIALYIARKVNEVIGIESVPEAVEDGIYNAELNGINNTRFVCGFAEEVLPVLLEQEKPDVLILDPPRKGADAALINAIIDAQIPEIIYVSCNPSTLARDVNLLISDCYHLKSVQPVDMFPMTGHVETIIVLCRGDT